MKFIEAYDDWTTEHPAGCIYGGFSLYTEYWLSHPDCALDHLCRIDFIVGVACRWPRVEDND